MLSCAHDICMGGCQHICSPTVLSNVVFRASYLPQGTLRDPEMDLEEQTSRTSSRGQSTLTGMSE